jgi:hypothetical protein
MKLAAKNEKDKSRAGRRRDRNRSFESRPPMLGFYLIVTDTDETEKHYFEGLKNSISKELKNKIIIKVEKAKTTYKMIEKTRELCGEQAQQRIPWIVYDREMVKDFDGIIREAERNGINAGWSNPCIEIWLYAYFGEMPNIPDSVNCNYRFEQKYKQMTGQSYSKNDADIYKKLIQYGDEDAAIKLAERKLEQARSNHDNPSDCYPACTIHELVKEIRLKTQKQ